MKITIDSVVPIDFEGLQIVDYTSKNGTPSSFAEITIRPGIRHRSGIAGELVYDFCVIGCASLLARPLWARLTSAAQNIRPGVKSPLALILIKGEWDQPDMFLLF